MSGKSKSGKPIRVGIAGLGTVGAGVIKILTAQADLLSARAGCPIVIGGVSARSKDQDRGVDLSAYPWFDDCLDMAASDDIDLVMELIGGEEGVARSLVQTALENGKHVVTANKALLAHHGVELARLAETKDVVLAYEAAVAGGIPVIKGLREGLTANRIDRMVAILNGTCNFVLSLMEDEGVSFDAAVKQAQDVGFAEADPTTDIGGFDAAHKLAILASIAFGTRVNFDAVDIQGIDSITAEDIEAAKELGYRIKLIAAAQRLDGGCLQRVQPALVPLAHPLALVSGGGNAIHLEGDWVGAVEFGGPGAGEGPTASAVVADTVDIARGLDVPVFGIPVDDLVAENASAEDTSQTAFYLRFQMADQKGTIAAVTGLLAENDISIETMIQRPERDHVEGANMPVIVITYPSTRQALTKAINAIEETGIVASRPHVIRVESL